MPIIDSTGAVEIDVALSKHYSREDLSWRREAWLRLHQPMSTRELDAVLGDLVSQLNRLPYLKIIRAVQSYGTSYLLLLKCGCKLPEKSFEIAQADIERIWKNEIATGMEAGHSVRMVENGFEFHFVALNESRHTLSGVIIVEPLLQVRRN